MKKFLSAICLCSIINLSCNNQHPDTKQLEKEIVNTDKAEAKAKAKN